MTAIIDYGVGNLFSLQSSLKYISADSIITGDKQKIADAQRIILPGVGAFGDAVKALRDSGLFDFLRSQAAAGKPLLGICLGMQMLFEKSTEYGCHEGLALIPGTVVPIKPRLTRDLKIPQMGWNALKITRPDPLLKYSKTGDYVYFVHSYYAAGCEDYISSTAEYEIDITASVSNENVFATQFHPEKSGEAGLKILRAFCEMK